MDISGVRIEDIPVEQIAETTQERKPPSNVYQGIIYYYGIRMVEI